MVLIARSHSIHFLLYPTTPVHTLIYIVWQLEQVLCGGGSRKRTSQFISQYSVTFYPPARLIKSPEQQIPLNMYVPMVVVGLSDGPHSSAALEIETRERVELGRAMGSEAMAGSVHERVRCGDGSCSGGRDRTGGGNWGRGGDGWEGCTWSSTVTTRSLRLSPPV